MIEATGLSKRLKIVHNTNEPEKFYLQSDSEDFEEFTFIKLGEKKIIEIISSCKDYPNLKKIFYYSETENKKIITSNISIYGGKLLLETFRQNVFLDDVEMINLTWKEKDSLDNRKKETLNRHIGRIEKTNLKNVSLGDAMKGIEYIVKSIASSY